MKELLETGVAAGLGYSASADALFGRINGLSVVIKENDSTKSYGCLIWVKKSGESSGDALTAYLEKQIADKPHIIKHFRVAERGVAIALVKYNDPVRNINNIIRFMSELADELDAQGYRNCCYSCGSTDCLGIYKDGNSIVQYCEDCSKGEPIDVGGAGDDDMFADKEDYAAPIEEFIISEGASDDGEPENAEGSSDDGFELASALSEAAAEINAAEMTGSVDELMAELPDDNANEEAAEASMTAASEHDDADIGEFMLNEINDSAVEEAEEPVLREEPAEEADSSDLGDFILSDVDNAVTGVEEASVEFERVAEDVQDDALNENELAEFMFDESTPAPSEAPVPVPEPIDEEKFGNANLRELALEEEKKPAEEELTEVTAVTAIGAGFGDDLEVETPEIEEFGESEEVAVTEIHDDSNDGEDIEIQALDTEFNKPTDTSGGELGASETPLEADGSVPMVNPKSDFADNKPSSSRDPMAVRAFAYSSYDYGSTADEPMGFDGRPKGYQGGDPRMGDEMGGVSRDYSRQQAAYTAPGSIGPRPTTQKIVEKGGKRSKPINMNARKVRSYSDGSHAFVGFIASLLFGIIGCALWCGIGYLLGLMETMDPEVKLLVMSVAGLLPTVFVFIGYRIGGDYFDGKGFVVSGIMSVIMDAVGMGAMLITDEMQRSAKELGYNLPIEKALDNVKSLLTDEAASFNLKRQLIITAVVMLLTLVISIVVAKKKSR